MRPIQWIQRNPPLAVTVVCNVILLMVLLPAAVLDGRLVTGQPVWIKPVKFAISLSVYSATLMWMLQHLHRPRLVRVVSWIIAVTALIEMICIVGQAIRGVPSHFNLATPSDALVFSLMGASITVFWIAHMVTAIALLRDSSASSALQSAIRGGLAASALGMGVAFFMTVPGFDGPIQMSPLGQPYPTGHSVGAPEDAPGLALLGWSLSGGDLRISHFVGLHGMQVIPLFALLLQSAGISERTVRALARSVSAAYAGIVIVLLGQALRGIPFHRVDSYTAWGYVLCICIAGSGLLFSRRMHTDSLEADA